MTPLLPRRVHRDPIGMRVEHVLMRRMRIRAGDHYHVQLAAARHEFAERVILSEPLTPIMQRNFRWIIRHTSTRTQTRGIGMRAPKITEPEPGIVLSRIVFDQRQL